MLLKNTQRLYQILGLCREPGMCLQSTRKNCCLGAMHRETRDKILSSALVEEESYRNLFGH